MIANHMLRLPFVIVAFVAAAATAAFGGMANDGQRKQTDADRAAEIVVRWQQMVYPRLEDSRAFVPEDVTDQINAVLSDGAVRVVQDRADAAALKKADAAGGTA